MEQNLNSELAQAQDIYNMVVEFFVNYSFQIIGAVLIILLGLLVARKVAQWVLRLCERKGLDITLSRFIASTAKIIVMVMATIIALGKIGISVTPFVAAVGALSLGAGLAVQGLLSNYGAGLNIIITRPFVIGDTISVQGVKGLVSEVHLATTILTDEDGIRITIPNRHIVGEIIHNSFNNTLAELSIGIAYAEDAERAIDIVRAAIGKTGGFDEAKPPKVGIESFGDSSVNLGVRVWIPTENYFDVLYQLNGSLFTALKEHGVEIPFPQREIRLLGSSSESGAVSNG